MSIQLANRRIETDEEGFLLNPEDWDECARIELTETHRGAGQLFPDIL